MIGLGRWQGRLESVFFSGDVTITIADRDGKYDIGVDLMGKFEVPEFTITQVTEDGSSLRITAAVKYLRGKSLTAVLNFEGDSLTGSLSVPMIGKLMLTEGHRV